MDEQLVLTAQTLRLNPDLQRADAPDDDVFVIKNVPGRKYLTISLDQWNLLRSFANPATAPDVLRAVILNRTCLPLREFYELILKAHRAGVLQGGSTPPAEVRARRWGLSVNPWISISLTLISAVFAFSLLGLRPFPYPGTTAGEIILSVLVGWVLLSAGLSLGQVIAASVLRAGGGEVYDPQFHLARPVPYFGVSLDDARMTSRLTQAGIWCARLFPVIATAAILWQYAPAWGFIHVFGVLVMLRPFAGGCMPELISTLCRGLVLDTQKNFLFSLNRRWNVRLKIGLSRWSIGYVAARLVWGVVWIFLVLFVGLRAANQRMQDVFGNAAYWREVGGVFAAAGLLAMLAYIGVPAGRSLWVWLRARQRELSRTRARWRLDTALPASEEQISRVLAESLLFRRIAAAERGDLRDVSQLRTFKSWKTIHNFNDRSTEVGVIISGKVAISRRLKSGRGERWLTLREGDIFGAHALLDAERQQAQIRTLTPVVALMIPIAEFERRVLLPLGVPLVNDLAHKVPFLRNLSFCGSWHPQAVARFAQLSTIVAYHDGELIVEERQDTQQFYVVYEGRVHVKRKGRTRAQLRAGAYFGEVSILQNSAAISDVVAKDTARCLLISKADFLRFVTHNPLVSLQLEEISSQRLGRPIFPLAGHSFETH